MVEAFNENQAIEALRSVQGLGPESLEKAIDNQVGAPMMQVMVALARTLHPDDNDDAVGDKVHLMLLSYLMAQVDPAEDAAADG